jgi:hypothetical protein
MLRELILQGEEACFGQILFQEEEKEQYDS